MKTAGAKWRSGTDTCIFKPAVKCQGEADVRPGISRVKRTQEACRDIQVETRIREAFPDLVKSGAVTVFDHVCTPEFTAEDLEGKPAGAGCSETKLGKFAPGATKDLVNMVTDEKGENPFANLLGRLQDPVKRRIFITRALSAAIDMVPDAGPWIIHADCHLGNVLLKDGKTTLSDWGRAIIIERPNDEASIVQGLKDWLHSVQYLGVYPGAGNAKYSNALIRLNADHEYRQHPSIITERIKLLFTPPKGSVEPVRQCLRGWLSYVLIEQTFNARIEILNDLLLATSQADLRGKVNAVLDTISPLPPPAGGMYWPLKYFRGLTRKENLQRKRSATRRTKMSWKDPRAYVSWKTDKGVKTRRSSYTSRFHKKCPRAKTLPQVSKCTKVPVKTLRTVYNRGMAAWRTGHRPGASQHAWGMARVHSFVLKGKTYRTADKDLAKK